MSVYLGNGRVDVHRDIMFFKVYLPWDYFSFIMEYWKFTTWLKLFFSLSVCFLRFVSRNEKFMRCDQLYVARLLLQLDADPGIRTKKIKWISLAVAKIWNVYTLYPVPQQSNPNPTSLSPNHIISVPWSYIYSSSLHMRLQPFLFLCFILLPNGGSPADTRLVHFFFFLPCSVQSFYHITCTHMPCFFFFFFLQSKSSCLQVVFVCPLNLFV